PRRAARARRAVLHWGSYGPPRQERSRIDKSPACPNRALPRRVLQARWSARRTRTPPGGTPMPEAVLDAVAIGELNGSFGGQLLTPDDSGYDEARKVFNAMIERRPALIARCAGVADVKA